MISLTSIYNAAPGTRDELLYKLLEERTPEQSISHKEMPGWGDHVSFIDSHPYKAWFFIMKEGDWHFDIVRDPVCVGSIYLTNKREIGISVFKEHQRKGYAKAAINELMKWYPGKFLANINPNNTASIKFFRKFGAKHIQNTYEF